MTAEKRLAPETGSVREDKITRVDFGAQQDEEMEIDLLDLAYALLDKLHYIILSLMIGAVLFNAISYFLIAPTYKATSKLYVVSASSDSVVNLADLNIGTSLTKDYEELIVSYPVLDQVIDKLGLDMEFEDLANLITLNNPDNTRVLSITATTTNPELSMDIANTVAKVAVKYLPETMSTLAPNIAQEARMADSKAGPSCLKYTMIGAVLGALLFCAFVIIGYLMDDTIHNGEDLQKYFGLVALTAIPDSEALFGISSDEKKMEARKRKK
ncbi:MAG: Wzz/FepE/Etk N-terminal domain-containing protein [Eubacteriales bacterium]|nr:Wzz/FepE/Etk N-terminal domain-containing protein [Eubacteriales bacterium]